jgi:hypothetical protein
VTKLVKSGQWNTGGVVHYRPLPSANNLGIEIGIDYAKAPVPTHFYLADYLSIEEDSSQVMFTFGKKDKPAEELRSKVEVYFNPVMFIRQYWASTRDIHKKMEKYVIDHGLSRIEKSELLPAPKVQTFQANQVLMLMTEGECLLDFFYLSPKDIVYKPQKGEKLDVEALVRIILSPNLVLSLLDLSQPIAEKLRPTYEEHYDLESK